MSYLEIIRSVVPDFPEYPSQQEAVAGLRSMAVEIEHLRTMLRACEDIASNRCAPIEEVIERLREELVSELRSELALASALGAMTTIAHCESRLVELDAAAAAGGEVK